MFLGPCPPGYRFLPKHKANSYAPAAQDISNAKQGRGQPLQIDASEAKEAKLEASDAVQAARAKAEDEEMAQAVEDW